MGCQASGLTKRDQLGHVTAVTSRKMWCRGLKCRLEVLPARSARLEVPVDSPPDSPPQSQSRFAVLCPIVLKESKWAETPLANSSLTGVCKKAAVFPSSGGMSRPL